MSCVDYLGFRGSGASGCSGYGTIKTVSWHVEASCYELRTNPQRRGVWFSG